MVKSCVFFAVRTEFLNIFYMNFGLQRVKGFPPVLYPCGLQHLISLGSRSLCILSAFISFVLNKRMRWLVHVVRMREINTTYKILVGKSEG
jgi:hypothetical protein